MDVTLSTAEMEPTERFWRFVHERQSIWHRRYVLKQPRPWSADPYLARFKFCNVQRDLDRGTQVIREDVLSRDDLTASEKVYAVVFYRMVNNRRTWRNLTGVVTTKDQMCKALETMEGKQGVWSNAWISTQMVKMRHRIVDNDYSEVIRAVETDGTTSAIRGELAKLTGLSGIVGFQMALDLSTVYPRRDSNVAFAHRSHHNKGWGENPGGSKPAAWLINPGIDAEETIKNLHYFRYIHLDIHSLDWQAVAAPGYEELMLHDIEHAMCEFTKYERVRTGASRNPSRIYVQKSD